MLHYLAATGGFVCRFLVHLHDFRQMGSWVSYAAFLCSTCPSHLLLRNLASSPSSVEQQPGCVKPREPPIMWHGSNMLPVRKPSEDPCLWSCTYREAGGGSSSPPACTMLLDSPW